MAATIRTGSPPKTPRSQQGSAPLTSSFLGSPTGKAAYVVSPPRSPSGSPFSVMSQAPTQTMGSPILESGGVLVETVRIKADPQVSQTCCLGIMYVKDCPHFPFGPIYLIVGGSIGILQFVYAAQECVVTAPYRKKIKKIRYHVAIFLFIFFVAWTFFGSIPFFAVRDVQWKDRHEYGYCDNTLYHFTFYFSAVMDVLYFTAFFGTLFGFILYAPTKQELKKRIEET
ncbi:hypothetical protein LSH36_372g02023 [Paralvinella palmiformis]|uniref:Uncharacterized protein n=1 Tax=Paralvinella palmiformis TaxID=53620 RepID=A0AAD9JF27_9ANNE|nr:hypothetical protein LSH36_372g02023 [Paralvinella palmiformis]